MTLGAITDESQCVVLEVLLDLGQRPVGAFIDSFFGASKIESLEPSRRLHVQHQLFMLNLLKKQKIDEPEAPSPQRWQVGESKANKLSYEPRAQLLELHEQQRGRCEERT
jgi:hypothetical protein